MVIQYVCSYNKCEHLVSTVCLVCSFELTSTKQERHLSSFLPLIACFTGKTGPSAGPVLQNHTPCHIQPCQ